MTFYSLLYKHEVDYREADLKSAIPDFFVDLHLDQIIDDVTCGKEEYDLKPFFYTPLHDADEVIYRQEVMKDIENPEVLNDVLLFAGDMTAIRHRLAGIEKSYYIFEKNRLLLDAAEAYFKTVLAVFERLNDASLVSAGLSGFCNYLKEYIRSEPFTILLNETQNILEDLSSVRYCVFIKDLRVEVHSYHPEEDYSGMVESAFAKFRESPARDYTVAFEPGPMNHVEASILDGVAALYPETFRRMDEYRHAHAHFIDETIARFDREIQFYISYAAYIAPIKEAGMKFCYPGISGPDKQVYNSEGFDLALAHILTAANTPVVCNDFFLTGKERIIVVSGPNQGGKTTFSRAFGQMHYLAALGLPIAGNSARLLLFDRMFTNYEREENIENLRSKLEDDLISIHDILKQASSGSIIILNEILSSATWQDAVFIGKKIMQQITSLDALCIWVTFIDELVALSDKTVSMVSTVVVGNPALRTFKIERRPADGLAYALSIAEKYYLTYHSLQKRLDV